MCSKYHFAFSLILEGQFSSISLRIYVSCIEHNLFVYSYDVNSVCVCTKHLSISVYCQYYLHLFYELSILYSFDSSMTLLCDRHDSRTDGLIIVGILFGRWSLGTRYFRQFLWARLWGGGGKNCSMYVLRHDMTALYLISNYHLFVCLF
jgi:hypothetical protein